MKNKMRKKVITINEEKNVEEAEILIAAEGVNNLLQEILEDLNDWKIKKFYTLVDRIRKIFGINIAEKYMTAIDETLNSTLNNLEELKQKFSYVNLELEKLVSGESTKFDIDFKNENKIDDENFIKKISNANKDSENKGGDIDMQKKLSEKWGVDFEVEKGEKGKWTPYSVKELCKKWKELREKKNKTRKDLETIRELAFAIRAKHYGGHEKWGPAKKVCDIEESYDETKSSSAGKCHRADHSNKGPKRKLGKKLMNENQAVIDFDVEKEAGDIGNADWILLYGNREELESLLQYFDVPASEYDDISGALVSPDYKELWVTYSSKPYLVNAKYYKVKTS